MPSGGGGGGSSTKTQIPGYLKDYSTDILSRAWGQSNTPYQAYTGDQQAALDPYRTQAWGDIAAMQGRGNAAYTNTENALQGLLGSAAPITAAQVGSTTSEFMNPYNQEVLNRAQEEFGRQGDIQQGAIGGQAANVGAFGGDRQGVMEAVMRSEQARNMGNLTAQVQQQGYGQALQNAMAMLQGNQGAGMQAAGMLPGVAAAHQAYGLADAQALAAAGQARQGYAQQGLDIQYQNWLRQQSYPQEQINNFMSVLSGVPGGGGTVVQGGGAGGLMGGLKGAAGGAASGAALGAPMGPYGALVGAGVGAVGGGLMGGL